MKETMLLMPDVFLMYLIIISLILVRLCLLILIRVVLHLKIIYCLLYLNHFLWLHDWILIDSILFKKTLSSLFRVFFYGIRTKYKYKVKKFGSKWQHHHAREEKPSVLKYYKHARVILFRKRGKKGRKRGKYAGKQNLEFATIYDFHCLRYFSTR